jgi:hypothetical protein
MTLGRRLRNQEAKLLNTLLCRQGEIVSQDEITTALWGDDPDGGPDNPIGVIKTVIYQMRRFGWPIQTYWGRGYMIPWREQKAPKPVLIVSNPHRPEMCAATVILDTLKANTHRFLNRTDLVREAGRRHPGFLVVLGSVGVHITTLREHGWRVLARRPGGHTVNGYLGGYRLDPSVEGTIPEPRYSCGARRYTNLRMAA